MRGGNKFILAIDLGTSAAKTALVSITGEVIGWEEEPLVLQLLPGGGAEQDPDSWWRAILNTAKRLLGRGLARRDAIAAVCATTQGAGTVPVDRAGHALMNCITWLDTRGAAYARQRVRGIVNLEGYDPLKLARWIRITGGAPSQTGNDNLGHMLYIKGKRPEIYEKTDKFLGVLDYLNLRLTGEIVATADSITLTWMTDNRDLGKIRFDPGLVKASTIAMEKLPPICRSIDVIGRLRPDVAGELGLPPTVQVIAGSVDYTSAAIGSGAVEDNRVHLYIGTSSWLAAHVPFKKSDVIHNMVSMPSALPEKYQLLATQDTAGGNLTFLRDHILFAKDALLQSEPGDFFSALNEVAGSAPPGSNGVLYTPWLYGERCPVYDASLRAGFHNLSLNNERADLVRAVLEGVALNTRWMLGPVEKFLGVQKAEPIRMVGGGARSDLWCQIQADVLDRRVKQIQDPVRVNVRGAAFIAALGLGEIRLDQIPALVQSKNEYEPNPRTRQLYQELYEVFVEIYQKNKGIYARLNRPRL